MWEVIAIGVALVAGLVAIVVFSIRWALKARERAAAAEKVVEVVDEAQEREKAAEEHLRRPGLLGGRLFARLRRKRHGR